jgi:G protein-coupled receptor GPR1
MAVGTEASDFAVLVIAVHSALYIFRPGMTAIGEGGLYHYRYYVYAAWFTFSLLMPSLAFVNKAPAYSAQGSYCYLPIRPFWYRIFLTWFPRYIILVTILILYASIYLYVRKKFRSFRTNVGSSTLEMDTVDLEADDKPKPPERLPSLEAHGLIPPSPALERDSRQSSLSSNYPLPKAHLPSPFAPIDKIEMHLFTDSSTSGGPSRRGSDFAYGYSHLLPERNPNMTQLTASSEMRRRRVAIDRQLRLLFIYPIFYTLMWVPPLISHCMQYTEHFVEHPSFPLACVVAFTVPFQCFVDCWLFTIREKPWCYIPHCPGESVVSRYGFGIRKCKGNSLESGVETCHEGAWKNQKHMSYEARKAYERRDAERREAAETWLDQGRNRWRSSVSWWDVGGNIEEETEEEEDEHEKEARAGHGTDWRASFSFDVFSKLEEGHAEQSGHHSLPPP